MNLEQSIQYTIDGNILPLNEFFRGKRFFRKYMNSDSIENLIYRILYNKGEHPNIVEIYRITDNYVDMELLEEITNTKNLKRVMTDVKKYLHRNNIAYIDWKYDNIGIDAEGNFKLFDFNASGIFNYYNEWSFVPDLCYVMRNAPKGLNPIQIDNWAFAHFNYSFPEILKEKKKDSKKLS